MQIIRDIASLRAAVADLKSDGRRVALVPTRGSLHAGHMALVTAAREVADSVVVSLFVNPAQFGPNEDFAAYPRDEAADAALLRAAGVDVLWAPGVATMYPPGHATTMHVAGLGDHHCGAARPGHFDGVAIIVTKLLNQVQPDVALFGEKDWQQLAIIRRMVRDTDMAVSIAGVPIERAADGLALSSRNAYLSAEARAAAVALPRAMAAAAAAIADGAPVAATLDAARADLLAAGFDSVDYLNLADADTLELMDEWRSPARLLGAARIGGTRLIDNLPVGPAR